MKVRIGIDVGGTFTDAVAIDDETYQLIGAVKIPTTHTAKEGVAAGIILVLKKILEECKISPEDVVFIAHGTTQATNALLEGDVAHVGILTLGSGLDGMKAKRDSDMGTIELAKGKFLKTSNCFVNSADSGNIDAAIRDGVKNLIDSGSQSIVATEAFSVDNPENENKVVDICAQMGYPATAGNDVSKLYGLKVRTRTAVINGSILPKMLETANMTEESIRKAKIKAPLMVMRCDGGVMTMDEVRKRPILTILSGPAAGVAGALMYEKLTDGIFLEVGGTSTDISCVKDGSVQIKYAEVGGHKTYLNSLDVRTVGIGGGSMIELSGGVAVDCGPRSAHIANLDYECYTAAENIVNPVLKGIHPKDTDPEYAYIECENGMKFALTLSGAANIAGMVPEGDYARGNIEAAKKAWKPLADNMHLSVEQAAEKVLEFAAKKDGLVVNELIHDYGLNKDTVVLVGGGGGASSIVPFLGKTLGCHFKIAKNASVISPIGVAMALVRDMVERTIMNPTEADILAIRKEALEKAVQSGADPGSVEVKVEIDTQANKLKAVAIGATELRTKDIAGARKTPEEIKKIVADNAKISPDLVEIVGETPSYYAVQFKTQVKSFLFFKKTINSVRIVDKDGIIRLQRKDGVIAKSKVADASKMLNHLIEEYMIADDGGEEMPNVFIATGSRIIDLSGMQSREQMRTLAQAELGGLNPDEQLLFLCTLKMSNVRA